MKNLKIIKLVAQILLFGVSIAANSQHQLGAAPVFQIQPQFFRAFPFSNGLARVEVGSTQSRKCGFVDKTGKFQISPIFDSCRDFTEGLAAVMMGDDRNGKWGYINKQGHYEIPPQFVAEDLISLYPAREFKEGLAAVHIGSDKSGKWGFINKSGKFIVNPQFSRVDEYHESFAVVQIGGDGGKWGHINKKGELLASQTYASANRFSEGLAAVNAGTKDLPNWIFINQLGEQVIKISSFHSEIYRWGGADNFKEGVGQVRFVDINDSNKWTWKMIDRSGRMLFDDLDTQGSRFSEGLARVELGRYPNSKFGFINKSGKVVIPQQFDYADDFRNGFAIVRVGDSSTGKLGFIDKSGTFVVNPVFEADGILNVFDFTEGLAAVRIGREANGLWGYIKAPARAK